MKAETITIAGHGGDQIEAYLAQPLGHGPFGGVVVIHHMPGYDRSTKEMARRFADEGYIALMPNLYSREAPGASPDDAAAAVRARGGVPDERLVGDVGAASKHIKSLACSNGKVGTIGYCSGGRQSFLAACSLQLDAAVDCYGAAIVNPLPEGSPVKMSPLVGIVKDLSLPAARPVRRGGPAPLTRGGGRTRKAPCRAWENLRVPFVPGSRARFFLRGPPLLPPRGCKGRMGTDRPLLPALPGLLRTAPCALTKPNKSPISGSGKGIFRMVLSVGRDRLLRPPGARGCRPHPEHRLLEP